MVKWIKLLLLGQLHDLNSKGTQQAHLVLLNKGRAIKFKIYFPENLPM